MNTFKVTYHDGTSYSTSTNGTLEEFKAYIMQGPHVSEDANGKETHRYVVKVEEVKRYYFIIYPKHFAAPSCFFMIYDRQTGKAVWESATYEDPETCTEMAEEVTAEFNNKTVV